MGRDLGSNFYLDESSVGSSRVLTALPKLRELNRHVDVNAIQGTVDENLLRQFTVLVLVGFPTETQLQYDKMCRAAGVKFIAANAHGVFASVFVDHGEKFMVQDVDGEQPKEGIITSVAASEEGKTLITVHEDARHGMSTGDMVRFEELEGGVSALNSQATVYKIDNKAKYTFEIEYDMGTQTHTAGTGRFVQVKQPAEVSFKTLAESIKYPDILPFDFGKFERGPLHHAFAQALSTFRTVQGRFPSPTSKEDATSVLEATLALVEGDVTEKQKELVLRLARCSSAVINPMAALFGGIVGQEVLKAVSGKFSPIRQFLYFDAEEVLPADEFDNLESFAPKDSRYDDMTAVLGASLVEKMRSLNVFIIGAGAIGCEMLKNWAMSGVACSKEGKVHVTDMDVIERGNLNRQFLFRDPDIGSVKSETAAKAAMVMNPEFNINAATNRVGKESENVYNEEFWKGLDLVITALDNVDARLYVDSKCVEHKKPLVDSGTVGTKGSTQVIVPRLTESYASSADPPPTEFPICLLKNFPNKIEHTIQWARDDFEGIFKQTPEDVNKYLTEKNFFEKLAEDPVGEHTVITNVHRALRLEFPKSWEDCVRWGVLQFTKYFDHNIRQLLYNFPADHLTKEGTKFWSGPKRAPSPLEFSGKDEEHMNFVQSAASLYAETFGIAVNKDREALVDIAMDVSIPEWKPKQGVKIAADDEEAKEQEKNVDMDEVQQMKNQLPPVSNFEGLTMVPLEFEKDDPTNWHVDYVTSCANLRARNYSIKEVTKHEAKRLAGRIIPAIATTTAMVTGFVCLEIMKIIQEKELEAYRNAFVNMAVPLFTLSEPMAPASTTANLKTGEWQWNMWDTLSVDLGNCTLQEFLDYFEDELGLDVGMITYGSAMIFAFFTPMKKLKVRKKMPMTELVELITKERLPEGITNLKLDVNCSDLDTDEDVDLPSVVLNLTV